MLSEFIPCTLRKLPKELHVEAMKTACQINPVNAVSKPGEFPIERLVELTSKYWGPQGVRLGVWMNTGNSDLQNRILSHMNAWGSRANVQFSLTGQGNAEVRIDFERSGYWSYLGTDILHIPSNQPTMNLQQFTMSTPESEYHRVVRHETGHTLGFPHEHMRKELIARLDPNKTISYFRQTQGWSRQEVIQQVLTPLDERDFKDSTAPDALSIMCYQLPGSITLDGKPIPGGNDIDENDYILAARVYPRPDAPPPPPPPPTGDMVQVLKAGTYQFAQTTTGKTVIVFNP